MKLETLKDLEKLINLCRKTGVETIKVDNVELKIGDLPYKAPKATKQTPIAESNTPMYSPGGITEDTEIKVEGLTDEQMLFWSTGGELQDSQ